jgi:hypothetical protein
MQLNSVVKYSKNLSVRMVRKWLFVSFSCIILSLLHTLPYRCRQCNWLPTMAGYAVMWQAAQSKGWGLPSFQTLVSWLLDVWCVYSAVFVEQTSII